MHMLLFSISANYLYQCEENNEHLHIERFGLATVLFHCIREVSCSNLGWDNATLTGLSWFSSVLPGKCSDCISVKVTTDY
jgi:hypothetical protein